MSLLLASLVSVAIAAVVGLLVAELLTWITGTTSPDRLDWARFVQSGGIFRGKCR